MSATKEVDIQSLVMRGLIYDMPSQDYHAVKGTFSSSQLKDLLDDEETFHKKYIAKTEAKEHIPAFDVGTYFHTALLEPDKLQSECAVFVGIRRGAAWEKFQKDNAGKAIITKAEHEQAKGIIKAVQDSPIAMARLARSTSEVSVFINIRVSQGEIFAPDHGVRLAEDGWVKSPVPKSGVDLVLKARADKLGSNFILDLKSTTGNAKSHMTMKKKVSDLNYDLSAALYLDLFTLGSGELKDEFIWTFASKDRFNSKSYCASQKNILIGRAKWSKAIRTLAFCIKDEWQFDDSLGVLEPTPWDMEYLQPSAEQLL